MFCGRGERPRHYSLSASEAPASLEVVSLLVFALSGSTPSHPFSLFKDSKIQIQGPNSRGKTGGYRSKSENMGEIGEKSGGVA